jgi:phosphoribosylformimino-5-aminoimidazole carboxamide ribotide isomerase
MTRFRPCIDLHEGRVKQIVGGSLTDSGAGLRTNFVAQEGADHFVRRFRDDGLTGGHVIMLGPGNEAAARAALAAWPGGLHLGGGIDADNARRWLDAGAGKLIVTSWLFPEGAFSTARLKALARTVGRDRLVIDLSCRRRGDGWLVATDRWQTVTEFAVDAGNLDQLAERCGEFLVHAADVEGLCQGIDEELVALLGRSSPIPCTYAGGAKSIQDLALVEHLSHDRLDLTFGSALDIFGGTLVKYADCVAWNQRHHGPSE